MADEINKQKLAEAILLLGRAYSQSDAKLIEKSINLLRDTTQPAEPLKALSIDEVPEIREGFIKVGPQWYADWIGGGTRPQELVLISATPHAGKTHLLVWNGAQYVLGDYRVLHFNGEDILADIKYYYSLAVPAREALLDNLRFVDVSDKRPSVRDIESSYLQTRENGFDAEVLVIDHVDLMRTASNKADWEAVSEVMADLKLLAKRTNTIIITATQQNFPNPDQRGMARFYRAKVGKAGEPDIILMVDEVIGEEYLMSRVKARGRRKLPNPSKTLLCEWDAMHIKEI